MEQTTALTLDDLAFASMLVGGLRRQGIEFAMYHGKLAIRGDMTPCGWQAVRQWSRVIFMLLAVEAQMAGRRFCAQCGCEVPPPENCAPVRCEACASQATFAALCEQWQELTGMAAVVGWS